MKLLVVAALIAVSGAARLEHLEQQQRLRAYLPPSQGSNYGSQGSFGSNSGTYGSFGSNSGGVGAAGVRQPSYEAQAAFPSVSNKYLPPSGSSAGTPEFSGSITGFGAQNTPSQYGQDATPQGSNPYGAQTGYQPQLSNANRQYIAPHSSQNIPQQSFDEQTGYHY